MILLQVLQTVSSHLCFKQILVHQLTQEEFYEVDILAIFFEIMTFKGTTPVYSFYLTQK